MGSRVVQSVQISVPHPLFSSSSSSSSSKPSVSFTPLPKPNGARASGFFSSGSGNSTGRRIFHQHCSANFDDFFSYEELSKQIEGLAQRFDLSEDEDQEEEEEEEEPALAVSKMSKLSPISTYPEAETTKANGFSTKVSSFKLNALEPSLLGIHPEPPDWPERTEIVRAAIERKANSLEFPMSLRLIKKKQRRRREESPKCGGGDFEFCSLNRAFSSMVFIVRELHSCALSLRESLYSEDLQEVIARVQKREMSMSFVWLFQQVFSGSPTLMVYVMLLLANFTAYSMDRNAVVLAAPLPVITGALAVTELEEESSSKLDSVSEGKKFSVVNADDGVVKENSNDEKMRSDGLTKHAVVDPEKMYGISLFNHEEFTTEEEVKLWSSLMGEASRMQAEMRAEALDHETVQQFVSPVSVNVEPDEQHFRTDLFYQMSLAEDPSNALLLSNYAQYLHVVARDYKRAEECFHRAIQGEKPDAEALSRYADFLWLVRKDLWAAEERYLQAMAMEPNSPYYASKYASFLWSTGGEDTCFPLRTSYDNYNKVF